MPFQSTLSDDGWPTTTPEPGRGAWLRPQSPARELVPSGTVLLGESWIGEGGRSRPRLLWCRPDLKGLYIYYRYSYKNIYKKIRCSADATPPSRPRDTTVVSARQLVWVVMRPGGPAASRRVPTPPFLFRPCSGLAIAPPRHPCGYRDHR